MMTSKYIIYLFVILVCIASVTLCQQQSSNQREHQNRINATQTPAIISSDKVNDTTGNVKEELLLSGEEFVDFTETPTLLFDGTVVENNGTLNASTFSTTNINPPSASPSPTQVPTKTAISTIGTNSTTGEAPLDDSTSTTVTNTTEPSSNVSEGVDGEELEEEEENHEDGSKGETTQQFSPPQNVSQYMDYIERLFHDLRHQITDLFEPHIPQLIRTSQMVQLSGSCSYDMLLMALALRRFEPWALRMIDSSGKVPEGIFEGSFTALGSYDECLGTVFAQPASAQVSAQQQQQQPGGTSGQVVPNPTQGKYCLVNVSPFLPPKPPADRVERMFQEEANRRNYTKDDQFSRLSPMFYYMQFRIGVCIPSSCVESDLDSISSALSSSLRLNITIPHCRVAQSQPITVPQLVGGLTFSLVVVVVVVATLMDYTRQKLHRLRVRNLLISSSAVAAANTTATGGINKFQGSVMLNTSTLTDKRHSSSSSGHFKEQLERHWSWMSFSLLANYRLYFSSASSGRSKQKTCFRQPTTTTTTTTTVTTPLPLQVTTPDSMIIRCLDGIRVLSLCWVIVANSYITLDPRATKRLTKTREAPKDFLFQMVAQASLAIETFFFLSGILLSLSFARKLRPNKTEKAGQQSDSSTLEAKNNGLLRWIQFYVHRYIRMTPATMLVIAFTMFAFRFGDGPLWFEATHKAHMSCANNWWRHLLHVANYIDTRQMCFIHYWYISADMQLFLFAPILMYLLYQRRRIGYALATVIGLISMASVFYTTYMNNLPPTLLFYNSDPESRREFGNTIMTKPLTHALPYMVGMLVGKWLTSVGQVHSSQPIKSSPQMAPLPHYQSNRSLATLFGLIATLVALSEVFLPYKWNNSHLPTRFLASVYAALFRLGWSLVLAYVVISCRHKRSRRCTNVNEDENFTSQFNDHNCSCNSIPNDQTKNNHNQYIAQSVYNQSQAYRQQQQQLRSNTNLHQSQMCLCGSGGNLLNRLLSLSIFTHLSRLSFVAYLIHLPLMSVFVAQTRGLFAFSHTLVIHLALSYLVMTFMLSFVLVHLIEFPFITFERYLFDKLFQRGKAKSDENEGNVNNVEKDLSFISPFGEKQTQVVKNQNTYHQLQRKLQLEQSYQSERFDNLESHPNLNKINDNLNLSERL